jgi:hypothetical protein
MKDCNDIVSGKSNGMSGAWHPAFSSTHPLNYIREIC